MANSAPNTFHKLVQTAQRMAETKSAKDKINVCADYFSLLNDVRDISISARFLAEGAFPASSGKRVTVGSRTLSTCAADFCEINYEQVFKPSKKALGSTAETVEKLMHNLEAARNKRRPQYLTLAQVEDAFESLYQVSARTAKQEILKEVWAKMTPAEIRHFIRILRQGSLGTGFNTQNIIPAIAKAFQKDEEHVRYVHLITGSIGRTAVLSRNNRLDEAAFRLFHPLSYMLASSLGSQGTEQLDGYIAEEKFNGFRCQAHISNQHVELYSRDLDDITGLFPDVVQFFLSRNMPDLILDGVICVFIKGEIRPYQLLQKRISSKKPIQKILIKFPVLFIAFDVLYGNDQPLFRKTLIERRLLLETAAIDHNLPIANQFECNNLEEVKHLCDRALKHGNDGLILKDKNSTYAYGQRSKFWLKVKQPGKTLYAVIMYAHTSSSKQEERYSGFTLGIRVKEDERYEEEFIPIGKVSGNVSDQIEMTELNNRIKKLTVEKYGPTLGLLPQIVVETEFDDIRVNKRTKAGYKLYNPRSKTIRWNLTATDADTLGAVEQMYQKIINRGRLKQDENPSFIFQKESNNV